MRWRWPCAGWLAERVIHAGRTAVGWICAAFEAAFPAGGAPASYAARGPQLPRASARGAQRPSSRGVCHRPQVVAIPDFGPCRWRADHDDMESRAGPLEDAGLRANGPHTTQSGSARSRMGSHPRMTAEGGRRERTGTSTPPANRSPQPARPKLARLWRSAKRLFNAAGTPCTAQPVRAAGTRMPSSLQLIGPPQGEELLLATALRVEAATR